ncbi:MAG: tetratricopeptide repeat protein, partial [Nitrospinaceae bacterium]|nr:tetratricopeptide repeat protein [Nitrospinaceae bacterium]
MGDTLGEARGYANLGNVRALQENWEEARDQYQKCLDVMERLENRPGIAQQCESLGDVSLKLGDLEKAEHYLNQARSLFEAMKDPRSVEQVQNKLLYIMGHPKYLERRREELLAELKNPEVEKDETKKAILMGELGNVYFMTQDFEQSEQTLRETIALQE